MVAVAIATESGLQALAWFFYKLLWTENCYLRRSGSMASGSGDHLLFGLPHVGSLVSGADVDVLLHDEECFASAVGFYYFGIAAAGAGRTRERVVVGFRPLFFDVVVVFLCVQFLPLFFVVVLCSSHRSPSLPLASNIGACSNKDEQKRMFKFCGYVDLMELTVCV